MTRCDARGRASRTPRRCDRVTPQTGKQHPPVPTKTRSPGLEWSPAFGRHLYVDHADAGRPWYTRPCPPRWHLCLPASFGKHPVDGQMRAVARCRCGAWRVGGGRWDGKNTRAAASHEHMPGPPWRVDGCRCTLCRPSTAAVA